MNQTARNNGVLEEVEIEKIVPFKEHSFKVVDNEEMEELAASIEENGVINPTIAFKNEEGR